MKLSRAGGRWTWLALGIAAAVVYGSFVPLRWRESSGQPVSALVRAVPFAPLANFGSSDFFTNLLVMMPLGFSGAAALAARSRPRINSVLSCSVLCAVLALAIEFGQLFVRDRTAAWSDVFALTAGGVAGALVWSLAGPGILAWLRQIAHGDSTQARFQRVLGAYMLFWWVSGLLPLLFPRFPYPLVRSVWLRPVLDPPFSVLLGGFLLAFMTLVPVGLAVGLGFRQRAMRSAALLTACVAAVILFDRIQQVPLAPTSSAVVYRLLGLMCGAWISATGRVGGLVRFLESPNRRALNLALLLWVCLLGFVYWAPFDFGVDADMRAFRIELLYLARSVLSVLLVSAAVCPSGHPRDRAAGRTTGRNAETRAARARNPRRRRVRDGRDRRLCEPSKLVSSISRRGAPTSPTS